MSRTGVLFQCDTRVQIGDTITAAVDWPVTGPDLDPLFLVLTGYVVRTRRSSVAVSVTSNRLLRMEALSNRFSDLFGNVSREIQKRTGAAGAPSEVILVEEDDSVAAAISGILTPPNWVVKRADRDAAVWLLRSGIPQLRLLITRTAALLDAVPSGLPAILTVEDGLAEGVRESSYLPGVTVLPKSLIESTLLNIVENLCDLTSRRQLRVGADS